MTSAAEHLAQYNLSVADAYSFITSNLHNPELIFTTCETYGVTNAMLSEITAFGTEQIEAFWQANGFDPQRLSEAAGDTTDVEELPQTLTLDGTLTYEIVAGTTGNDVFTHQSGNKIYLGMSGDDTFLLADDADGIAIFMGGVGNDIYEIDDAAISVIRDVGGGSDKVYDNGTDALSLRYSIDGRYVEIDYFRPGELIPYASTVFGDLSDQNDYIETFVSPELPRPMNQTMAMFFTQVSPNWIGDFSSEALGVGEMYERNQLFVDVYNQYVDAGF